MKSPVVTGLVPVLTLLSLLPGQAGDYASGGGKDVAKSVIEDPSDVDVSFIMPGWLAGIEGSIGFRPDVVTGVDSGFDDILPTVDMIAAATMEIRKDKLGFILDGMYMKMSVNGETPGPLLNDITLSVKQALVEGVVTYRIMESDRAWVELLAGGRYNYLGNRVTFNHIINGPEVLNAVNSWVDPFVGIQGRCQLTDRWYAKARGDYGGFGISSEETYNLFGVFGYQINERTSMELGYRYLYTDYRNGGFSYDMATKGAFLGFRLDL